MLSNSCNCPTLMDEKDKKFNAKDMVKPAGFAMLAIGIGAGFLIPKLTKKGKRR